MTNRIGQHQLEDISRAKFSLTLPRQWVYRNKEKDYGIDGEVEIFEENGRATGHLFLVQLKATESVKDSVVMSVNLKIETIKYYKRLEIPVLLVRYSDRDQSFFYKWAHEIDLFYASESATTFKVKFTEQESWTEDTPKKIINRLEKIRRIKRGAFALPIPIKVMIEKGGIKGFPSGVMASRLRDQISNYSSIALYEEDDERAIAEAKLSDDRLSISLCGLTGCTFHNLTKRDADGFIEGVCKDILLGISAALSNLGHADLCGRIIFESDLNKRLFIKKELLSHILPSLLNSAYFGQALDLINHLLDEKESPELIALWSVAFNIGTHDKHKIIDIEKFLQKRLVKAKERGDDLEIGISNYNLGNHYRSRGLFQKAERHYLKARKAAPIYLNQHYYWSELGGILFLLGKYKAAVKAYEKSLSIGAPLHIQPRYADALMQAGKYYKAMNIFNEYLKDSGDSCDEWHLKARCLETIIRNYGVKEQFRHRTSASSLADVKQGEDTHRAKERLEKALSKDMLCSLAWFNLGMVNSKLQRNADAAFCFTMCGLIQPGDVEAWVNATLYSFDKGIHVEICMLVIRTAYFFNREQYLDALYKAIEQKKNVGATSSISELVEQLIPKKGEKDLPEIRILNQDGKFVNILNKVETQ